MKTYPIRMTAESREQISEGNKTETRRTNLNWLKVKKGDRLRVLQSGGMLLEATADAREERLQDITESNIVDEGCPKAYLLGRNWFIPHWDSINGKKPGLAYADNPTVVVLAFRRIDHA